MRKKIFACFCIILLAISANSYAQSAPNKKVLLSLQPGETIITGESCIDVSVAGNQLYVVTQQGDMVYVYEGGQRKGPYKSFNEAKVKNCNTSNDNVCSIFKAERSSGSEEFFSYTNEGKMMIKFNGKTYGPYKYIKDVFIPENKSTFVASVASDDMKFSAITPNEVIQPTSGSISSIAISSNYNKFLAIEKEGEGIDPAFLNTDFSKLTTEQIIQMAKEQEEKRKNAGEPKAYIHTNGGKKFGPYPVASVSDYNPAFSKTGGNNWYMVIDNTLYINGVKVQEFTDIYPSTCNIWISADGKRYMVADYDKMVFSDGTKYAAPIKITTEIKEGKTLLKWVSFENEKELISYSREL